MTFDEVKPYVTAAARHVLTTAATALAGWGAIQPDQETQFVAIGVSALVWGAGLAWSWWQKELQKRQVAIALATQPPSRT